MPRQGTRGSNLGARGWAAIAGVAWALSGLLLHAQAPVPQAGGRQALVIDTGTFTPFVEDMDRSLAFYRDVFGMEVPPLPAAGGPRPYNNPNPGLFAFFDIPGARERHQSARVPGIRTTVEAMEIQQVPFKTVPLRLQDPGNATLVLVVRDIDATLAKVKAGRYPVVTPRGTPVTMGDGTRAVIVRDVDNRFVELRQPPSIPADAPAHNVIDIRAMVTVADLARTVQVYRDVFGFAIEGESRWAADPVERALTGLASAEQRHARARARDSQLWLEFVEFKGVDRTPLRMKIQDRGAARLQLRAQNIDALVDAARRAGLTIVTQGGVATPIPPNLKGALIADPNNFFVSLFEPCDGCSPRERLVPATAGAVQTPAPNLTPGPLTDRDKADISALWVTYRETLFACDGAGYAGLFATPGGYFASAPRGEIRERSALMEMVVGYDRCKPGAGPSTEPAPGNTTAGAGQTAPQLPVPVIEPAPEGARARIVNSRGGGYYDDVYVKTPAGWKFKSRTVIADDELAAGFTTRDFIEIRALAGDDHGYYEDLYGQINGVIRPRALSKPGEPFRTAGLRISLTKDGAKGLAYLRNNGGHYEDTYVRTPQGWRIAERKHFPPDPRGTEPTAAMHWSAAKTRELIAEAAAKVNPQTGMSPHRFMESSFMMYREKSSGAEAHTGNADFIIVNDGVGTIVVGGRILNGKVDRPGEIRGDAIEGGTPYVVRAGDTLYVPKNAAHQFQVDAGQHMVYTVVKVTPVD